MLSHYLITSAFGYILAGWIMPTRRDPFLPIFQRLQYNYNLNRNLLWLQSTVQTHSNSMIDNWEPLGVWVLMNLNLGLARLKRPTQSSWSRS